MTTADRPGLGDVVGPLRVGPVAHGGHWVARHEGQVLFVRHALEGELVSVRVTGLARRFARADVVAVHEASPHRVEPPCPIAGVCGGCDFQHVDPEHQRELKRSVLDEQLRRLAGQRFEGEVEAVPPVLSWRTRMRYSAAPGGDWGLRASRSHEVVPLPEGGCRIARPEIAEPDADAAATASGTDRELVGAATAQGPVWVAPGSDAVATERAAGRAWRVDADGFWQVHERAADTLVACVLDLLRPVAGESALDLYCGVGLFAGALVDRGVRVRGVEGDADAVRHARRNVPGATFIAGDVARTLRRLRGRPDLVVLDPPRTGAGEAVMRGVLAGGPRAVAYVACDPAALARDLGTAASLGWRTETVRAFDLFGMTHHLEAVALITR